MYVYFINTFIIHRQIHIIIYINIFQFLLFEIKDPIP